MRTAGARSASRSTGVDLRLLCPQVLLQSPSEHMIEHMETSAGWPEFAPPVALSSGPLGVVQAADREIARLTALRARAVAEFAASRPASVDRRQGEPGAMSTERWVARPEILQPVSEWATPELQVALSYTEGSAQKLLEDSLRTVQRLPGVLAALEGGWCGRWAGGGARPPPGAAVGSLAAPGGGKGSPPPGGGRWGGSCCAGW